MGLEPDWVGKLVILILAPFVLVVFILTSPLWGAASILVFFYRRAIVLTLSREKAVLIVLSWCCYAFKKHNPSAALSLTLIVHGVTDLSKRAYVVLRQFSLIKSLIFFGKVALPVEGVELHGFALPGVAMVVHLSRVYKSRCETNRFKKLLININSVILTALAVFTLPVAMIGGMSMMLCVGGQLAVITALSISLFEIGGIEVGVGVSLGLAVAGSAVTMFGVAVDAATFFSGSLDSFDSVSHMWQRRPHIVDLVGSWHASEHF